MTDQNLPVPSSYTQSLIDNYKRVRDRLNRQGVPDPGIRCVSASERAGGLRGPDIGLMQPLPPPTPLPPTRADVEEWVARQKKRFHRSDCWFSIVEEIDPAKRRRPTVATIQRVVSRRYNVSRKDLNSARRLACVVRPRQIAMYVAKQTTIHSLPELGRLFGGRDHTTVLYAVRKIEGLAGKDAVLAQELAELIIEVEGDAE